MSDVPATGHLKGQPVTRPSREHAGVAIGDGREVPVGFLLTGVFLLFLLMLFFALGVEGRDLLIRKDGVVESATVVGYLICLLVAAHKGGVQHLLREHAFVILIVFFMLRELGFDKKFTTMGIFKSRFYLSADVPLIEKGLALIVVAILVYAVASIFYKHWRKFSLRGKSNWTVSLGVFIVFVLLVVSKSLDGIGRKLQGVGYSMSERIQSYSMAVEEILEFGIPLIILSTYFYYFRAIEDRQGAAAAADNPRR